MTEKQKVIAELTTLGVEINPGMTTPKLKELLEVNKKGPEKVPTTPEAVAKGDMEKLMSMVSTVISKLDEVDVRVNKIENGGREDFKIGATEVDIEKAAYNKAHLDPKVVKIVEETLGVDFGIELDSFDDRPGFLFTVVVPKRLSDLPESQRPVMDTETGSYKIIKDGGPFDYVMEVYQPQDRRSKQIGSGQSYDAIRDHCNRVRSYIVSYYQKLKKPLPEFKLKN